MVACGGDSDGGGATGGASGTTGGITGSSGGSGPQGGSTFGGSPTGTGGTPTAGTGGGSSAACMATPLTAPLITDFEAPDGDAKTAQYEFGKAPGWVGGNYSYPTAGANFPMSTVGGGKWDARRRHRHVLRLRSLGWRRHEVRRLHVHRCSVRHRRRRWQERTDDVQHRDRADDLERSDEDRPELQRVRRDRDGALLGLRVAELHVHRDRDFPAPSRCHSPC
jgi:hypothetical protein